MCITYVRVSTIRKFNFCTIGKYLKVGISQHNFQNFHSLVRYRISKDSTKFVWLKYSIHNQILLAYEGEKLPEIYIELRTKNRRNCTMYSAKIFLKCFTFFFQTWFLNSCKKYLHNNVSSTHSIKNI